MLKNRSHGAVHDRKKSLIWCAGHKRWVRDINGLWKDHTDCDSKVEDKRLRGLQGMRRSRMLTKIRLEDAKKEKRTSDVTRYCSKHGRFGGYQWGGHRRKCNAVEVDKETWKARSVTINSEGDTLSERTIKTLQRGHALRYPTRRTSEIQMAESIPIRQKLDFKAACREIGIEHVAFTGPSIKGSLWLKAMVLDVAKDHPSVIPFYKGAEIFKINEAAFKSCEEFVGLINNAVDLKEPLVWLTYQQGEAAPVRRTIALRSHPQTGSIFVPDEDIIVKVVSRLKAIDTEIANAKAQADMYTKECLELPKKLREARDAAQQADKRVGELEGKRREFMNGIGHALKGALK